MLTLVLLFSLCTAALAGRVRRQIPDECPMCDYVYREDPSYGYSQYLDPLQQDGYTTYYINVTSQTWFDESWTDRPVWWHYLVVHVPDVILYPENAFLYVTWYSNEDNAPSPDNVRDHHRRTGNYARETGIVAAVIEQVLNQPVVFTDDPEQKGRSEDDTITYTWREFLETEEEEAGSADPEIVLRMPMCKAVVKAFDTIEDLVNGEREEANINKFMLAGESKRGWTTWIVGAIEERIIAMAPVVLSDLHMHPNHHHYCQSFNGWPEAMYDYWDKEIVSWIDEPESETLGDIVDPYSYIWGMDLPILMISGSSDEFFLLDDSHYFFDELPGQNNYVWIKENSGHCVGCNGDYTDDYWRMLETFYLSAIHEGTLSPNAPVCTSAEWQGEGSITVQTDTAPTVVTVWSALSNAPDRRDWRRRTIDGPSDIEFIEGPVEDLGGGAYKATFQVPSEGEGYLAFWIKLVFPGPEDREYILSTEAQVLPNCFPYQDCEGRACQGTLV